MATIERRMSHGQTVYYAKVRRKGFPPQSATFPKLSDAKSWIQRSVPGHIMKLVRVTLPRGKALTVCQSSERERFLLHPPND